MSPGTITHQPGYIFPSELLYDILADITIEYIDFAITEPYGEDQAEQLPDRSQIDSCLVVSYQFRDILLKVISHALGVSRKADGSLSENPWSRLIAVRRTYYLGSRGHCNFSIERSEALSPLLQAYDQLSSGLHYLEAAPSRLRAVTDEWEQHNFIKSFQYAWQIRPTVLRTLVLRRVGDLLCSSTLAYRIYANLLCCWNALLQINDSSGVAGKTADSIQDLEGYLEQLEAVEQDTMRHYREIHPITGCAVPKITCSIISAGAGTHLLDRIPSISVISQNERIMKLVHVLSDRWIPLFERDG